MKHLLIFGSLALLIGSSFAQDTLRRDSVKAKERLDRLTAPGVAASRSEEKTLDLPASATLRIVNTFGDVRFLNSKEEGTRVEISYEVEGANESKAQTRLDDLSVRETRDGNTVSLETHVEGGSGVAFASNQGVHVHYTIYTPADQAISIEQRDGILEIGDRTGPVDITLKSGKIYANRLESAQNTLDLDLSSGRINYMAGGELDARATQITLDDAGNITLKSEASRINIERVGTIQVQATLGEIHLNEAGDVSGSYKGATFSIATLFRKADLNARYAPLTEIMQVAPGFESLAYDGKMAPIRLGFDPETHYELEATVDHGDFTPVTAGQEYQIRNHEDDPRLNTYSLSNGANSRSSEAPGKVKIRSSYGAVKLARKEDKKS